MTAVKIRKRYQMAGIIFGLYLSCGNLDDLRTESKINELLITEALWGTNKHLVH